MGIQAPKSQVAYSNNIFEALSATGITQTSPGGKARAFVDAVASEMALLDAKIYSSIGQSLVAYATGNNLDFLGQMFGVDRLQRQDSSASSSDSNFIFYVKVGNFGNINNGQDITVPAGTRIYTSDPNGPVYTLVSDVLLPANQNSISFSVMSLSIGVSGNSGANTFNKMDFSNYADSYYGSLLVTNNYGLISGRDQESDDDYRYRINLKLQSNNGAAEAALRLAILSVPGIQNVVFERLAGTFNAYIFGISPQIPPSLLTTVQSILNNTVAYPLVGNAIAPDLIGISLETSVSFTAGTSSTDQTNIVNNAIASANTYINNLGPSGTLVINQLASQIIASDSRILTIGNPDAPITAIYIWRSRADGSRYSRSLINDYSTQLGERLVVEFDIDTPINLTVNS